MKTGILASPTISEEGMTASTMGMSMKGVDIAAYFLRDKIYTNKALAVIREYICNAVDEHDKHKIDKPVLVSLYYDKDSGKWVWSVRDFAKGLSDHGVRNIFGMYFESTKSDDNNMIGGFGIGSKAGLCYSDTFYITSYHEGVKMSYVSSLGAGNKGVPVGEIYDISTEPTTESGIEIKIEVDASDVRKFFRTCANFVQKFSNKVALEFHTDYDSLSANGTIVYTPIAPVSSVELPGGYVLNRYDHTFDYEEGYLPEGSVGIRMGGVVYTHMNLGAGQYSGEIIGSQILDVPIGNLSIPISRENIENTQGNTRVFDDIRKEYVALIEQDRASLVLPKLGEILERYSEDNGYTFRSNRIGATMFSFLGSKAYPEPYKFVSYIRKSSYIKIPRNGNGKHVIYMLPDIKNQANWIERLRLVISTVPNYVGHYFITKTAAIDDIILTNKDIDFSDVQFVDIKTLKLPPLPKNPSDPKTKYLVYNSGYKQGSYTPEELDEYVTNKKGIDADLDTDWWLSATTIKALQSRTIGLVNKFGAYNQYFTANSKKMVDAMLEMGWLSPDSQDYLDSMKRIQDEENERVRVGSVEPNLRASYFDTDFHPNIIKALIRDGTKMERLKKVRNAILTEDSTRGRILRKLSRLGSYDGSRRISREDLRRIMALK